MKKSDLLIEILSWIAIIMIIGFFVWINWELKQESGDGMQIAMHTDSLADKSERMQSGIL